MKKIVYYFFITLVFFGILIKLSYATDTYQVFNWGGDEVYAQFASSGRFITGAIGKFIKTINLPEKSIYLFSYFLAIICAVISQYRLYKIIDVKNKIFKIIIPTLIILNLFSIELFLFIENGIMMFGILICIYGLENLIKYFNKKQKKYIFYSLSFVFLANCCYQGVVGLFASLGLVYILNYSKTIKQFIKNNIVVGLIYAISAILNIILVKMLFKSSRIGGQVILIESFKKIYKGTINMIVKTYGILPKYIFILAILFTFVCFCSKILKERGKFIHIAKIIYLIIGIIFFAVAPQFIQQTQSIWFVPRSTYCFASLYGILLLYLISNYNVEKPIRVVIITISVCLIFLQLSKFIQIEKGRYTLNKKDYETTISIISQIKQYEEATNKKIKYMALYNDQKPQFTYDGVLATGDINVKCYANDWSAVAILNYYLKRNITLVEKDNILNEKFLQKNWNQFNKEQIIFKEDTINICNY